MIALHIVGTVRREKLSVFISIKYTCRRDSEGFSSRAAERVLRVGCINNPSSPLCKINEYTNFMKGSMPGYRERDNFVVVTRNVYRVCIRAHEGGRGGGIHARRVRAGNQHDS